MDVPELRPLSLGELLDRTFSYYRRHFWLFVGIMAVPQVIIVALSVVVQGLRLFQVPAGVMPPGVAGVFFTRYLLGIFFFILLYYVFYALALGATTFAVSEVHLGRECTVRGAYGRLRGHIWPLWDLIFTIFIRFILVLILIVIFAGMAGIAFGLLGGVLGALVAGAGAMLIFLAGTVLTLRLFLSYGCSVPALLLENLKALPSIKRSVALTKKNLLRVFFVGFLMTLVAYVGTLITQGPFLVVWIFMSIKTHAAPPLWLNVAMNAAAGVGKAVTAPLLMIGLVLLYYDLRVRKEGFDLQLMMSALEAQGTLPAPGPAPAPAAPLVEKIGILRLIFLTLITAGLYYPVWFLRRRNALNRLRSSEKLGFAAFLVVLVLWIPDMGLNFLTVYAPQRIRFINAASLLTLDQIITLAAGLLLLFQAFKVRRILEDHITASSTGPFATSIALSQGSSLSGVATFFFGIFYLQYKINELADSWAPPQPDVGPGIVPAI